MKGRFSPLALGVWLLAGAILADDAREVRKIFLRARGAVSEGRYPEALELYRRVIEQIPEDAVVRYEYGQLLRDLNVSDEAIKQAREAARLDPNLAEAQRLLGALELAHAEKDPSRLDRAIEALRQAHRLAPRDTGTAATLARALLTRGRPREAALLLDEVPEARTQPGLMRLAAEARARSGRTREAESLYQTLLEADPSDRDSSAALVDLYEGDDRIDLALRLLEDLERRDPENLRIPEQIILDLARAGRFEEAEKRARELIARRPENRDIRRLLGQVLFDKGDTAVGEKVLRDLLRADPEDAGTRRFLASELGRERRFTEARSLLEESLRRAGSDPKAADERTWATVELGYLAFLEKDYAASRKTLEPVGTSGPGVNVRAMRILLAIARDREDFAFGLARAEKAAALDRENPEWLAALAEFQYRTGNKKAAEEAFLKLASSDDSERVLAAADARARLKDFSGAAKVAREASRHFPESTEALFRLGSSLERAGTTGEAEKVFLQLLEVRPNDAATQNYLGYMWADRGVHLEKARDLLEKAVAREPRNGAFQDSLGWVYFRLNKLEAAEKHLQEAHRRDPDDPTIEEHLGDLFERRQDFDQAVEHWERALALKHEEPEKVRQKLARWRSRTSRMKN